MKKDPGPVPALMPTRVHVFSSNAVSACKLKWKKNKNKNILSHFLTQPTP